MTELTVGGLGVSLAIMAIVEALKQAFLPSRFAFLTAVLLGAVAGVFAVMRTPELPWLDGVLLGIMSGGAASGAYSGAKSLRNGNNLPRPLPTLTGHRRHLSEEQLSQCPVTQAGSRARIPPGGAEAPAADPRDSQASLLSAAPASLSVRLASEFVDGTGWDYS